MKKRKKAIIYTIVFLILIAIAIYFIPNTTKNEDNEQILKFKDKDSYTFTETDETINFLIDKKDDYELIFDAKVESAPAILIINDNELTINKNAKYNITLNKLDSLLEISLKSSKSTTNIENINLKDIKGEHLHLDNEKITFLHDIDKAFFDKNLKKVTYSLELKVKGEDSTIPVKLKLFYGSKSKDIIINQTDKIKIYNIIKIDLGTLEGNQTFKLEPRALSVKIGDLKHYQTIYIKDIKIIKPSGDKKVTISNIKLTKI